jgi:hypothetical protein
MPKVKISEFSATPGNNTDIDGINLAEGCAPSGINDAIRELMSQLKDWQSGTSNDPYVVGSSGSLTLNQGTANGVPYLNGSKVLTSGSALTFDGSALTTTARLLVGTSTGVGGDFTSIRFNSGGSYPQGLNMVDSNASASGSVFQVFRKSDDTYLGNIRRNSTDNAIYVGGNSYLALGSGDTEQMRLTSTGLGIGTSSPAAKLDVNGGTNSEMRLTTSGSGYLQVGQFSNGAFIGTSSTDATAGILRFGTGGTERARIDSSGNLGLGVTPSAWWSGRKSFQFGGSGNSSFIASSPGTVNFLELGSNSFVNSSVQEIYYATGAATKYVQVTGAHQWFTAPSGTAGNAISFTQAMSLLASGDLAIGRTSAIGGARVSAETTTGTPTYATYLPTTGTETAFLLVNPNGTVGSITTNGSATTYATSSDYRLKNITGPITTSGAYIDSLNPVEGTWKADGSTFVGLIAHEVQESSRTNVATGTKDGEEMQAMDYSNSEIIANLIAEVKSLRARVASLESN